jgi:hypothetical protein
MTPAANIHNTSITFIAKHAQPLDALLASLGEVVHRHVQWLKDVVCVVRVERVNTE